MTSQRVSMLLMCLCACRSVASSPFDLRNAIADDRARQREQRDARQRATVRSYTRTAVQAAEQGDCERVYRIENAVRAMPPNYDGANLHAEIFAAEPRLAVCLLPRVCAQLHALVAEDPSLASDPRYAKCVEATAQ